MTGQQLKNSILQEAIQGRLVPNVLQPGEKTGAELLQDILAERQKKENAEKGKKAKKLTLSTIEEEPWELPKGWCWCHIHDVAHTELGKMKDSEKNKGEFYPYLCTVNVREIGIDLSVVKQMKFTDEEREHYLLKRGDLLICEGGDCGRCSIWDLDLEMYYQNSVHCARFEGGVSNKFFKYVLDLFKYQGLCNGQGVGIKHFTQTLLRNLYFPLPPLSIQKSIVEKIESLFPLVDEYDKAAGELKTLNEELPDKLRKSVLQEAIHGNLVSNDIPEGEATAAELLQQILKERQDRENKEKGKKAKKLTLSEIEEEPWELPKGWCWCKLSDCLDVRDGTHDSPTYLPSGYPLITSKDFCNGRFDLSKTKYISEADYQKICIRSRVDIGDILYSMIGGNIGNMLVVNANNYMAMAIKNVALFKQYPGRRIDIQYVAAFLTYMKPIYQTMASGGAQPFIGLDVFRNTEIPLPPLSIQKAIVAKIEEVFAAIEKLK